jgi:hypothetical protein
MKEKFSLKSLVGEVLKWLLAGALVVALIVIWAGNLTHLLHPNPELEKVRALFDESLTKQTAEFGRLANDLHAQSQEFATITDSFLLLDILKGEKIDAKKAAWLFEDNAQERLNAAIQEIGMNEVQIATFNLDYFRAHLQMKPTAPQNL